MSDLSRHLHARAAEAQPHPVPMTTLLADAAEPSPYSRVTALPARRRVAPVLAAASIAAAVGIGALAVSRRDAGEVRGQAPTTAPLASTAASAAADASTVAVVPTVAPTESAPVTPAGSDPSGAAPTGESAIHWMTEQVDLRADSLSIEVGGVEFTSAGITVEVDSDPGDAQYQTLELTWVERDVPMRWYIYLRSDGSEWWSDEFRTYNGTPDGDWVTFTGDFFRRPLGQAFEGDLDLSATENGITSHIVVRGLQLRGFANFNADGSPKPPPPIEPKTLAEQGLAAAPPMPEGLPATGRTWTPERLMAMALARNDVVRRCMADAGFDYPQLSFESLIHELGGFDPESVLGLRRAGAARLDGYRSFDSIANDPAQLAIASLPPADAKRFEIALRGDPTTAPPSPLVNAEGEAVQDVPRSGGCEGEADTALGGLMQIQARALSSIDSTISQAWELALRDPRTIDVLDAWRTCVDARVGLTARTPNELVRDVASAGLADADQISIAVADAECQARVDLQNTWYTIVTEYERALMGDRVGEYDELVRMRQQILDLADRYLAEHGITPPSLD